MKWFRKAAEAGNADAQTSLGGMYDLGWGVPQNYAEAMKWFRKAAEQGNADAETSLGGMYEWGKGVPQDKAEAAKWYVLAVKVSGRRRPGQCLRTVQARRHVQRRSPGRAAELHRSGEVVSQGCRAGGHRCH
jgi:hypothetical protein